MEKFKHKNGMGSMFPNEYKKTDSQPSWRGTIVLPNGEEWRIAAWSKSGVKGDYLSLALDQYEPKPVEGANPMPQSPNNNLPF